MKSGYRINKWDRKWVRTGELQFSLHFSDGRLDFTFFGFIEGVITFVYAMVHTHNYTDNISYNREEWSLMKRWPKGGCELNNICFFVCVLFVLSNFLFVNSDFHFVFVFSFSLCVCHLFLVWDCVVFDLFSVFYFWSEKIRSLAQWLNNNSFN